MALTLGGKTLAGKKVLPSGGVRLGRVQPTTAPVYSDGAIQFAWAGANETTLMRAAVRLNRSGHSVRFAVSTSSDLSSPTYSPAVVSSAANYNHVQLVVSGLTPGTLYYWGIEVNGNMTTTRGKGSTMTSGVSNFRVAFSSCARSASTSPVFDNLRAKNPLFFIHQGDMHYDNIVATSIQPHLDSLANVVTSAKQRALYQQVPLVYQPDDHDTAGDNAYSSMGGVTQGNQAYQLAAPHYPLSFAGAPHLVFTCGRVRFIILNTRVGRTVQTATDDSNKSMIGGAAGFTWLKNQLLTAHQDPTIGMIVLGTQQRWLYATDGSPNHDAWNGYNTERQAIADYCTSNGIAPYMMSINGDSHVISMDSGAGNSWGGWPVFEANAMQHDGTYTGNTSVPADQGIYPNADDLQGHYGILDFSDNGTTITVTCTAWETKSNTDATETQKFSYVFAVPKPA